MRAGDGPVVPGALGFASLGDRFGAARVTEASAVPDTAGDDTGIEGVALTSVDCASVVVVVCVNGVIDGDVCEEAVDVTWPREEGTKTLADGDIGAGDDALDLLVGTGGTTVRTGGSGV